MFVPFIFSLSTINDAPFLWWFYKGLDFSLQNHTAIVAQEIYCKTTPSQFAAEGYQAAFIKEATERFGYKLPKNRDLKRARLYPISDALIHEIVKEQKSLTNAFCYLLTQEDEKFMSFLDETINQIERECGEKIEGFITLSSIPSLSEVSRRRGIPVIHFELGCWRIPCYLNTAFLDLKNLYGGETVERRWAKFCEENKKRPFNIFSKKECLALLLRKNQLHLLEQYDHKPTKKIGAVLGYVTYELISCKTHLNDSELLYRIKKKYTLENMLIRMHPGDPYGGQYPQYSAAIDKQKRSTPEFILDCETVISLVSGSCIEAMLWGRKAITLLPSPSYFASGHEIEGEGLCADENFISFFAFCYLIPFKYLMDVDYLRWRLTNPPEREIYYKHLRFYFEKKGLPSELILSEPGTRLTEMLKLQGYELGCGGCGY